MELLTLVYSYTNTETIQAHHDGSPWNMGPYYQSSVPENVQGIPKRCQIS